MPRAANDIAKQSRLPKATIWYGFWEDVLYFACFTAFFAVDLVRVLGVPVLPVAKEDRLALIEPMAVFCDDVY